MQVPVIQTLDSAIHQKNHYPKEKCWGNQLHYPWVEIYSVYSAIHWIITIQWISIKE